MREAHDTWLRGSAAARTEDSGNFAGVALPAVDALVSAVTRATTKAELLDRVWPGLVVEENNLQVQVSALRKLLGSVIDLGVDGR